MNIKKWFKENILNDCHEYINIKLNRDEAIFLNKLVINYVLKEQDIGLEEKYLGEHLDISDYIMTIIDINLSGIRGNKC